MTKLVVELHPGRRWSQMFKRARLPYVQLEDDGMVLVDGESMWRISWAAIRRITARKYDLLTTDALGLAISLADGRTYDVTEDVEGYGDLLREMYRRFPEISPGWEREITIPAFQTNERVIYSRE